MTEFEHYSLALCKDGETIFTSEGDGLKPLIEAINLFGSKYEDCVLHDKVVGTAAARVIVYSGMISSLITERSTKQAVELLKNNYIKIDVKNIVDTILNKDKSGPCLMELKSREMDDDEEFFIHLKEFFGID